MQYNCSENTKIVVVKVSAIFAMVSNLTIVLLMKTHILSTHSFPTLSFGFFSVISNSSQSMSANILLASSSSNEDISEK